MRVAVLAASGAVAQHVVNLLLARGHTVVAIVRTPSKVAQQAGLEVARFVVGEDSVEQLAEAIRGCAMVLSCIGNRRGEAPVVTRATAVLLEAMKKSEVQRMAMISAMGVGDSDAQLKRMGLTGWLFVCFFATVLHATKKDLNAAEQLCLNSETRGADISCVIVRPAGLTNSPGSGEGGYDIATTEGVVGDSISREDVAHFMVSLLEDKQYDGKAISLGGRSKGVWSSQVTSVVGGST